MTIDYIFQRVKKVFPNATLREVVELVNEGMRETGDVLGAETYTTIDVVDGQRYYDIATLETDTTISQILEVFYMDSEDKYRPITRYVFRPNLGDTA